MGGVCRIAPLVVVGNSLGFGKKRLTLTSNAIKFMSQGSVAVRVALGEETAEDVHVRFEVKDSGIGIAADDQERLFRPFEQADGSTTRTYGGTGLGLAISKHLAQLMDGDIGVASEPGAGSVFWCDVVLRKAGVRDRPKRVATDSGLAAEEALRSRHRGRRVLLVDDDPLARDVAKALLEHAGLTVELAEDGLQAVELAGRNAYDLILMDIAMPKMDGLEATRIIRTLAGRAQLPIVALTANVFVEDKERCLAAGMNDHLAKPIVAASLFAKLLGWLDGS